MKIIEKLKQGDNSYHLNQQLVISENIEPLYCRASNATYGLHDYYSTPPYLMKESFENLHFYDLENYSNLNTVSLNESYQQQLALSITEEDTAYIFLDGGSVSLTRSQSGTSSAFTSQTIHLSDYYFLQTYSSLSLIDTSDISFACRPFIKITYRWRNNDATNYSQSTKYNHRFENDTDSPIYVYQQQAVYNPSTGTYDYQNVPVLVGYNQKMTDQYWTGNITYNGILPVQYSSIFHFLNSKFSGGFTVTTPRFQPNSDDTLIRNKSIIFRFYCPIIIKISNLSANNINTPEEIYNYFLNHIDDKKFLQIADMSRDSALLSTEYNELQNDVIEMEENKIYLTKNSFTNTTNQLSQYVDGELITLNSNDYIYFTQSEIDEIFNS